MLVVALPGTKGLRGCRHDGSSVRKRYLARKRSLAQIVRKRKSRATWQIFVKKREIS